MDEIICPQCRNLITADNKWDFMDGEEHEITCSCGYQFVVIIERPIEYYIPEVVETKRAKNRIKTHLRIDKDR